MQRLHEADGAGLAAQDDGMGDGVLIGELDASQHIAGGHAGRDEHDVVRSDQIIQSQDFVDVRDAHIVSTLGLFVVLWD